MKLAGSYTLPGPRARIFAMLIDEGVLARCVPGVKRLVRERENYYTVTLDVGLGPVQGTYEGSVTLSELVPPERVVMLVEGKGKLGFVRGKGSLVLGANAEGGEESTRVDYDGDVQIGGSLASVGQRMIQSASKMMAGQFFAALGAEAAAAAGAAKAAATAAAPAADAGARRSAAARPDARALDGSTAAAPPQGASPSSLEYTPPRQGILRNFLRWLCALWRERMRAKRARRGTPV